MKHSLYLKFILTYVVFGFLSFFVIATFSSQMTLNHLTAQRAENLYKEANYISTNFVRSYYSQSQDADSLRSIHSQFQALDIYLGASIWLLNSDGTILVDSDVSFTENPSPVISAFDPTDMGNRYYIVGNFYDTFDEEVLSVAAPITYNFRTRGYVLIHTPLSSIEGERDQLLNITYLTVLLVFLLSLLVLAVFTFTVYRPLMKITEAARQYAQGNFKYALEIYEEDEIGQLADTLNYMSHELGEMDEYQKKFVANISHDFRSPLTSIKGYVEAMLDGTIPPEMQEKYLNIVLMETERLNKLTTGLLALNSFDTKRNRLDITSFDINGVIKNTVSSFEGQCRDRRITIELLFDAKQQYVSADMGKIQQVMYNLLDNAIKFSPNDSVITIETTLRHEKVFISVKDEGIGIPKDSMKKIWERFYKTDASRGRDKRGTGLGLSIVKEIVASHGEHINAISTEGVGTEFIFTLPRVPESEDI
ncbi:HAMP domain-containing sensor histidine kinase [Candidatus Merdisoma sp. JLR.KK006]|uniref:sensor histidine kinase n=1 Tax=Candidatus Merdisoma sp. JLR.KK006 TaxID=3112626 RepID=UPI002FF36691